MAETMAELMRAKRAERMQLRMMGAMIRRLRLARGMTQGQFAQALGSTRRTVIRWEAGESTPTPMAQKNLLELKKKS